MGVANETKESGDNGDDSAKEIGYGDAAAIGRAGDRLFTSDFVLSSLANFVNAFSMWMLVALLPVYVISLGGTQADAGLVTGALAFMALLCRPLSGWLTDAWRRRPMVLIGASLYGVASVLYSLAGSIPILLVGRLVHGFGLSCYSTASNVYVADISPLKRRAEAVGLFSASQALGLIIGPVIGFMLVASAGFQPLFHFTAGLAVIAFLLSIFTKERRQPATMALLIDRIRPEQRGVATSTYFTGFDVGITIGTILLGVVSQHWGFPIMWLISGACTLLSLAGIMADRRHRS